MYTNLQRTLQVIKENLPADKPISFEMLETAYEQTLWLRSHILGVMYDMMDFGATPKRSITVPFFQTDIKSYVSLVIPEPLPGLKELTGKVEEHWIQVIHEAIAQKAKTGIPYFEKAHVHIRITAPRGTYNSKVWDTSNRAINVIINNLKGIFFDDDDFAHMSFSVDASWGETGMTEVRICNHKDLKKYNVFQ